MKIASIGLIILAIYFFSLPIFIAYLTNEIGALWSWMLFFPLALIIFCGAIEINNLEVKE